LQITAKEIPTNDFFGIFWVKKPEWLNWNSYFKTIDALRPLFFAEEFEKVVHGFYLNHINNSENFLFCC